MNSKCIVLTSIGSNVYLEVGALTRLERVVSNVDIIVGASTSSIIAVLLACLYTPDEVKQSLVRTSVVEQLSELESIMVHLVKCKIGFVPTFEQLYRATGIDLILTTTNLTKMENEVLSKRTTPNLDIIDALVMATHLPFISGVLNIEGSSYADGCLTKPYPVDIIDPNIPTIALGSKLHMYDNGLFGIIYKSIQAPIVTLKAISTALRPTFLHMELTSIPSASSVLIQSGYEQALRYNL